MTSVSSVRMNSTLGLRLAVPASTAGVASGSSDAVSDHPRNSRLLGIRLRGLHHSPTDGPRAGALALPA